MRLVFQTVELSAGGKGSPVGLSVGGQKQIDTASFLRAAEGKVFDRGNKIYQLSWQQHREFATVGECESFILLHAANAPDGEGTCTITTEGGATITLTGAVLQVPKSDKQVGASVWHNYELVASGMTGAVPSALNPNGSEVNPPINNAVTHNGETVTHDGQTVTHS